MSKRTFRCYVDGIDYLEKTDTGKRKVWRTDGVPTHCCSLSTAYFIWEKGTRHNGYNGYSGYVSSGNISFIDAP